MWKIALVFFIAVFNFGYWYWTTTPYYAVLQIRDAVRNHSLKEFEEYVDIDSVASKMIDGFLTPQVRSALGKGVLGDLLGSGLVYLIKPTLVDTIKEEVSHFVENNTMDQGPVSNKWPMPARVTRGDNLSAMPCLFEQPALAGRLQATPYRKVALGLRGQDITLKGVTSKLGFGKGAFKGVKFVRVQSTVATIGVELYNQRYNSNLLLELKMMKEEGRWRLVEVSNFPSFVYMIIAYEQHRRRISMAPEPNAVASRVPLAIGHPD